ncbi:epithelial-stromal interaction protein 1 isoform X1 [Antechinus flavipes]|uniref:epithelial-stromal interaction protein 1 isoform X1 n=1 Tax=Antechinus flavipes TaxID=38775 RepID=UPI002235DEBC|nr:epithelial-stromal interaction protein 1 isoform X1 [Antechinus flavipes]
MYSRSRVSFSQPSFSSAAWHTVKRRPEQGLLQGRRMSAGASYEDQLLESSGSGPQNQKPMAGFTVIAPDQIRRDKLMRTAKKELEDLEKWKQQERSRPIHTKPNKLGGKQSEAEVRKKQQHQLLQSKYQQKLKREECVRVQKEVEEAKLQAIKAIQREKSNKLEEKTRLQEKQRREAFNIQNPCKSSECLNSQEPKVSTRSSRSDVLWKLPALHKDHNLAKNEVFKNNLKEQEDQKLHKMKDEPCKKIFTSNGERRMPVDKLDITEQGELLELKRQWQEEERTKAHQREQRRVNNAFLDRIQSRSQPSGLHQFGSFGNMNCGRDWGV